MRRFLPCASVLLVVLLVGCGTDPLGAFPREFTNADDRFEFETLSDVIDITRTETFDWSNSGITADISSQTTTNGGEARLVLRDAGGAEVYNDVLTPDLAATTQGGESGAWTIELVLTNYSGSIHFVIETPSVELEIDGGGG